MPPPRSSRTRLASPPALSVRFWGVRGSVAVPGPATVRFGGNTACVEVRSGQEIVILDAGTGIRPLGKDLVREFARRAGRMSILITHTHWDHIQGFPFFAPAYLAHHRIRILGGRGSRAGLRRTVAAAVESPFFPVALPQMPGCISVEELPRSEFRIGSLRIRTAPLNHPGGGVAFRLSAGGSSLAYVPDHEIPCPTASASPGARRSTLAGPRGRQRQQAMQDLIQGVHLLIHDAQYTAEEYSQRVGWGHSCLEAVVKTAAEAGVAHLMLFHHDPDRSDSQVDDMLTRARQLGRSLRSPMRIDAAREGDHLGLPARTGLRRD